jgi:hypothetical protein
MTKPNFDLTISIQTILTVIILIVGLSANWYKLNEQLNISRQKIDNLIVRFDEINDLLHIHSTRLEELRIQQAVMEAKYGHNRLN